MLRFSLCLFLCIESHSAVKDCTSIWGPVPRKKEGHPCKWTTKALCWFSRRVKSHENGATAGQEKETWNKGTILACLQAGYNLTEAPAITPGLN